MTHLFGSFGKICTILAVIGLGLTLSGCGYNTIPQLQETAKARWSDVQTQYQRRAALIPPLVAPVPGSAAQEISAYNTALRTFPTIIWAKTAFAGEKPMAEFTANEGAATPPQVKF